MTHFSTRKEKTHTSYFPKKAFQLCPHGESGFILLTSRLSTQRKTLQKLPDPLTKKHSSSFHPDKKVFKCYLKRNTHRRTATHKTRASHSAVTIWLAPVLFRHYRTAELALSAHVIIIRERHDEIFAEGGYPPGSMNNLRAGRYRTPHSCIYMYMYISGRTRERRRASNARRVITRR